MSVSQLDRLREVALDQHGLVTVDDARRVGIPSVELAKLHARGRIKRKAWGVYQVPYVPETPEDEFHLAVLWTGHPEACLSHETALELWDLSDSMPDRIHLTVPRGVRIRRRSGDNYAVHHQDLTSGEVGWWRGIPMVTPETAISQCVSGQVSPAILRQAIDSALARGIIHRRTSERLLLALEFPGDARQVTQPPPSTR